MEEPKAELIQRLKQLDKVRKDLAKGMRALKKAHESLPATIGPQAEGPWAQVRSHYLSCITLSEEEESLANAAINCIETLEAQIDTSSDRKRKQPDTLAVPNPLHPETKVACLIDSDYILCVVKSYSPETHTYNVADFEDVAANKPTDLINLPAASVLPLVTPNTLTKGAVVLAIYPGTTAFYRADLIKVKRKNPTVQYVLEFEDDHNEDGKMVRRTIEAADVVIHPSPSN